MSIGCTREMRQSIEDEAKRLGVSLSHVTERWLEDGRFFAAFKRQAVLADSAEPRDVEEALRRAGVR